MIETSVYAKQMLELLAHNLTMSRLLSEEIGEPPSSLARVVDVAEGRKPMPEVILESTADGTHRWDVLWGDTVKVAKPARFIAWDLAAE